MKLFRIITAGILLLAACSMVRQVHSTQEDVKRALFLLLSELAHQGFGRTENGVLRQMHYAIEQQQISPSAVDTQTGQSLLMAASRTGSLPLVIYLVAKGANVLYKSPLGETALMYAALSGSLPVTKFLIAHGADPNANSYGWSVLKWSKDFDQPTDEVTRYLYSIGVRPQKYEWGYSQEQQKREQ